jgi:IS5 family transposase
MYSSKSNRDGRPNHDVIMMFKVLILQQWYGLSDMETERQIADRISFMEFLGYPETIPDSRTICIFRELMAESGTDKIVWNELQNQLDAMRLKVKRGTAQDATFIKKEDPGTAKKPRGSDAKSQRSKDDT